MHDVECLQINQQNSPRIRLARNSLGYEWLQSWSTRNQYPMCNIIDDHQFRRFRFTYLCYRPELDGYKWCVIIIRYWIGTEPQNCINWSVLDRTDPLFPRSFVILIFCNCLCNIKHWVVASPWSLGYELLVLWICAHCVHHWTLQTWSCRFAADSVCLSAFTCTQLDQ